VRPWLIILAYGAAISIPLWIAVIRKDDSFMESYMRIFVISLAAYLALAVLALILRNRAFASVITLLLLIVLTAQIIGGSLYIVGITAVFSLSRQIPSIVGTIGGWIASGVIGNLAYAVLKRRFRFFSDESPVR